MKKDLKHIIPVMLTMFSLLNTTRVTAQRFFNNPLSQYYRNGYLWNPALSGQEGSRAYALLHKSWAGFEGAPRQISLAGDMKMGEKAAVGIRFIADKSGMLQRNMGALSYAYGISFSGTSKLSMGLNVGFYKERLDNSALAQGGQVDEAVKSFNEKGIQFDGDFGIAYEGIGLKLGAAAWNLSNVLKSADKRSADLSVAQVQAAYRFECDGKTNLQPMVAYKLFYKQDNIFTAGMQYEYENIFHAGIFWQSTGNAAGGVGILLKEYGELNFFYNGANKYGYNKQYEVGLKVRWK
ncbi:PorP/SprF family type IX secretion system membrane protein [Pseudoflavitalea sp. X16]|uniref:PorP/SprF family type IX secretion system membrane protein n=1 Tax=Paraflavitalea devenefica TaxID=2716334 RepID=UPI0014212E45|nr:PorP/SprF family type IX secretion system membrane protein [Paraflavitalea devenefica]NII27977.1 PorP/SprF family type IX secretion system membrane protein [Paraflavitalea devenefica]